MMSTFVSWFFLLFFVFRKFVYFVELIKKLMWKKNVKRAVEMSKPEKSEVWFRVIQLWKQS